MCSLVEDSGIFFVSSFTGISKHFNGIAYLDKDIVIGELAFFDYASKKNIHNLREGRFTAIYQDLDENWIIKTDDSGQGIIYFYQENGVWAFSNSFLYMVEMLYKNNIVLTSNFHTILGFNAFHSTTEQPVSNNTMIKEIKTLPFQQYVKIKNNKPYYYTQDLPLSYNYVDDLVEYRNKVSSRILSLNNRFSDDIFLDISGGYDSRTVFSFVLSSGIDLGKLNIRSNRKLIDDFTVATELANTFKFKINNKGFNDKSKYSDEDLFNLWKYGNLGIYFPVYTDINSTSLTQNFQLHGAGGGGLRGVVNDISPQVLSTRLATRIKNIYPKLMVDKFKDEVLYGAKHAGISKDSILENIYYSNYRSRFHFGRNQYRSLYSNLITPLASTWLCFINEEGLKNNNMQNIYVDLMLLADKRLPEIEFDKKEKNFSKNIIENSPFYKKNYETQLDEYDIYFCKNKDEKISYSFNTKGGYAYFYDEIENIIKYSTNPLVNKIELKAALDEARKNKNVTKNNKIMSFNLSVHEISKYCSDLN